MFCFRSAAQNRIKSIQITETDPTVQNGQLTLSASGIASGSGTFTANQSANTSITFSVPATDLELDLSSDPVVYLLSSTGNSAALYSRGVATLSPDGTTTAFAITHELTTMPAAWIVTPASSSAADPFRRGYYVTAHPTDLTLTFLTPPPAGTMSVSWVAYY
jgi:hypothetical protein